MEDYISLSELNLSVKEKIEENFFETYFITAEINELRENRGHAYLELVEKDEDEGIKAKARASVWASKYGMLKAYFENVTGQALRSGLKVLIKVRVTFHEIYGYSLNIIDIDPSYTIGEIERKRLLIIKRLEEEGVVGMNKELDFPLVPQRIAVISSDTAAGYGDFISQLNKSPFYFKTELFKAVMQGEDTEDSVVDALERIYERENEFDLAVIIRGGGSKSDLAWFDSYKTAVNTAQFPMPVLTGIGHERDKTVTDIVAYKSLNTPTATAEFIIDEMRSFYDYLIALSDKFKDLVSDILFTNNELLKVMSNDLKFTVNKIIFERKNRLNLLKSEYEYTTTAFLRSKENELLYYSDKIKNSLTVNFSLKKQSVEFLGERFSNSLKKYFSTKKHELDIFEEKNKFVNPQNILKAGYSYTLKNGKTIKSSDEVKVGDVVETILYKGKIRSEVKD